MCFYTFGLMVGLIGLRLNLIVVGYCLDFIFKLLDLLCVDLVYL